MRAEEIIKDHVTLGGKPSHQAVQIDSLSSLTGFPEHFIKSELLIEQDVVSLDHLRQSMLHYLESTFKNP